MLQRYLAAVAVRRRDLEAVRESLGDHEDPTRTACRFPRMVTDWGLEYYASGHTMVTDLLARLDP